MRINRFYYPLFFVLTSPSKNTMIAKSINTDTINKGIIILLVVVITFDY
jgi:hypothetical protein